MANKNPLAYRNIREMSEELELEPHVLRFWESKFETLQPMTRGGGRRFYAPSDVEVIIAIRSLLYDHGLTIKAASKIIDQQGLKAAQNYIKKVENNDVYHETALSQIPSLSETETQNGRILNIERLNAIDLEIEQLEKRARSAISRIETLLVTSKEAA